MSLHEYGTPNSIRRQLNHPVIDADGHLIEFAPIIEDYLADFVGPKLRQQFRALYTSVPAETRGLPLAERRSLGLLESATWSLPTVQSADRATSMLPRLLADRLDELGLDFCLLYPTLGLGISYVEDEELRRGMARAYNRYYADVTSGLRGRIEPVAAIPMVTPQEAVEELDYAAELGLRSVVMAGTLLRRTGRDGQAWVDSLGHESAYDYDPVWQACLRHGIAPTFHGKSSGWGSHNSTSNYVFNHLGDFAHSQEAVCRSLILGGVPHRFPTLAFGFLEGGVSWAAQLLSDLISHFKKRNAQAIKQYDPSRVDFDVFGSLFEKYADLPLQRLKQTDNFGIDLRMAHSGQKSFRDDFAESGLQSVDEIIRVFGGQCFFGCEADDRLTAIAFLRHLLPGGVELNAMFSSDIGHWDVEDASEVLSEAWELVDDGILSAENFASFAGGNVARMVTKANPSFFESTVLAGVFPADPPKRPLSRTGA